jgi:hypothetical protein
VKKSMVAVMEIEEEHGEADHQLPREIRSEEIF